MLYTFFIMNLDTKMFSHWYWLGLLCFQIQVFGQSLFTEEEIKEKGSGGKCTGPKVDIFMVMKLKKEIDALKRDVTQLTEDMELLKAKQTVISACNRGYTFVENIGLLYKQVDGLSYADAMQQCKTDGASLLLVNSRETLTYFHNLLNDTIYDYGRGTDTWGVWINGKYDNGSWLDGTNKILENIYWDSTAPLQPYVGTCMTFSYTQRGLLITNRDCTWRYISFCQVMI